MSKKKSGIVLAGGAGTRLSPLTDICSKQLLPIFNKPVISYPMRTLQDMGIDDVLVITADKNQQQMTKSYLGDGFKFGMNFSYAIQDHPNGLAEAFIIADREKFVDDNDEVVLILGDNILINQRHIPVASNTIFTYKVNNPSAYGVVTTNEDGTIDQLIEKPKDHLSNDAVIGLYQFGKGVVEFAKQLIPSPRGELEIVDLIKLMNEKTPMRVEKLDGFWFDVGTFDDLLDCANLVRTITHRTSEELGLLKVN
jgi:glucose-1-phosphate thymidylyltransferase